MFKKTLIRGRQRRKLECPGQLCDIVLVFSKVDSIERRAHGTVFPGLSVGPLRMKFIGMTIIIKRNSLLVQPLVITNLDINRNITAKKPSVKRESLSQ